jgi:putative PEP-CTERM system histidine kinase
MVHDLKNVIAQQDLVLQNAARFKTNPVFLDDALTTIANSVERMRRMLDQFRTTTESARRRVSLKELLGLAVRQCERHQPMPKLQVDGLDALVVCDPDRLAAAFAHLIRNGQQATTPAGSVLIDAMAMDGTARVSITDDGAGMDAQFVRDRLFSPFYTTKGSQGMGIGAYQARETILAIGGKLSVESTPGKGTTMRIELPALIAEVPLIAEAAK